MSSPLDSLFVQLIFATPTVFYPCSAIRGPVMRLAPSFGIISRTTFHPLTSINSCSWTTIVRHGSKRTRATPYIDPVDWTRERAPPIRRSLYHNPEEYTEEPKYPEIVPRKNTPEFVRFTRAKEGQQLEKLSLKEKMNYFTHAPPWKHTRPRELHWDTRRKFWQPFEIAGFPEIYNITPFYQYLTRTVIVSDELPRDYYSYLEDEILNGIIEKIREPVKKALLAERKYFTKNLEIIPDEDRDVVIQAQNVMDAITRAIDLSAGRSFPHLHEMQRDLETKCSAFWKRSGFSFEGQHTRTLDKESGEMKLQYVEDGNVFRLFRHELPLPPVIERTSTVGETGTSDLYIPEYNYCPSTFGFSSKKYIPHWIPGFWFGDPCEFSTLSLTVPRKWTPVVDRLGEDSAAENLAGSAVMAGFGRVVAQAMFLGFSILNELTYPIVTQSILTNGRDWVFSTFQGNTIAVWKADSDNPYCNLAWVTPPLRLFERIDEDEVVDFNEEVLKNIVRQYLKAPVDPGVELRPFLGNPIKSYWKNERSRVPFYHRGKNLLVPEFRRIPKHPQSEI